MPSDSNIVEFPPRLRTANKQSFEQIEIKSTVGQLPKQNKPKGVALALGGGVARGWAHIGVLRAMDEAKIPVSMIAGTSIGALVGGFYLAGKLDELEAFARSLSRRSMLRYADLSLFGSGLIAGKRLASRMKQEIGDIEIFQLNGRFTAIATDIKSGNEIWLENGSLEKAIRASYALPGIFEPVTHFGKLLVDGALVNPVPISACRACEEKIVIAVNLGAEVFGRSGVIRTSSMAGTRHIREPQVKATCAQQSKDAEQTKNGSDKKRDKRLGISGVMIESFYIIQDKITRSRMAGDPPDFTIRPQLANIGLSDFHKAGDAIEEGYLTAKEKIKTLIASGLKEALET